VLIGGMLHERDQNNSPKKLVVSKGADRGLIMAMLAIYLHVAKNKQVNIVVSEEVLGRDQKMYSDLFKRKSFQASKAKDNSSLVANKATDPC
jgi:hypothetical protein